MYNDLINISRPFELENAIYSSFCVILQDRAK